MASAYELMLVLRGRNYLSNDLRRAGGDISRLKSQAGLTNARQQLQINAQRLASTRAIAQAEAESITTGQRHNALSQRRLTVSRQQAIAAKQLSTIESEAATNAAARTANAEKLASIQTKLNKTPVGSANAASLAAMQQKLVNVDKELIAEQAKLNDQMLIAQNTMAKVAIAEQGLIATETAHAQRLAILTDRINTTTAAEQLNTVKLNENALAIKRLPLETLGARARYVEHLGRAFQTLGLVSVVALGIAAHSAAAFNTQITLASTQATLIGDRSTAKVQANAASLQASVQRMLIGGQTAAKPSDLTGGLYTIFSGLSLQGNQKQQLREGLGILKEFNTVFTANFGQVSFNDVTKAGIALINNFALGVKQIPIVMNQMQASVRFGAMTMGEMTSSLNQVIPAFKAAGYSTKQMFEDIAFVSRVFPSLRIGTTGLARLTETFAKYHDAISQDIGVNIAPGGKLQSVSTIVSEIIRAHPHLVKGGVDLQNYFKAVTGASQFVNARRVFSAYATDLKLYDTVAGQVGADNKELVKSFRDMAQTPQVRWGEFTNQLKGLAMEIGGNAIPVFQKLAKPVEDAVKWFDKLSPATKKTIGSMAAWIGVGMLFGGTALVIAGALGRMYAAIRLFLVGRAGIAALEEGFIGAGTALRVGLIGALILAIPLMVKYHTQVGHMIDGLGGLKRLMVILTIAFTAFKFSSFIKGLNAVKLTMDVATLSAARLRLALLAINAIGIVTATVVITYIERHQIDNGVRRVQRAIVHAQQHSGFVQALAGGEAWIADLIPGVHVSKSGLLQPVDSSITAPPGLPKDRAGLTNQDRLTHPGEVARAAAANAAAIANRAKEIKKVAAAAKAASFDVNAAIANLEKLRAISVKAPTMANFLAYENAKAALEKHFTGTSLTALQDYLSNIESAEKKSNHKRLDEAKKAAAERLQALKDAAANALSIYDQLLGQNQSIMGSLFSGPYVSSPSVQNRLQYGGKLTGKDYLKDLRSQTAQFSSFYSQISKLQRRGAPQELINQLIQAGPQALPAIRALANMGTGQWGQYIKVFKHGQDLLHKQTMIQLTAQLKDYRKYGEKIALQIISGMRDKRLGLANEIKSIIQQIFGVSVPNVHGPGHNQQSDAHRAARQHAGRMPHGVYHHHNTNSRPVAGTHVRTTQSVEYHTHFEVTAPTSEHSSIRTQLRHADFASKAKYERTR